MNTGIIPSSWSGPVLSLLRIVTGVLFIAHGTVKLFAFPAVPSMPGPVPLMSFMGFTGALELVETARDQFVAAGRRTGRTSLFGSGSKTAGDFGGVLELMT